MKHAKQWTRWAGLSAIALLAGGLHAADGNEPPQEPVVAQRQFDSPALAVKALQTAAEARDKAALTEIFGPEFKELSTGDDAQDATNAQRFARAMAEGCNPVKEGEDKITLEVGTNDWPMPIPLVKADGQWHFDTAAGKEEIINRHIGKDELHAVGVCRAYVKAQQQYAHMDAGPDGSYALKFKSDPRKRNGLYWPAAEDAPASPFGPLVAEAQTDGHIYTAGAGPQPFHGYYFRILTWQGRAAPGGKMDYMSQGLLSGGFALVAYPAQWDKSGVMTFIVNQSGNVYERNLAEKTARVARRMKSYNPDSGWTLVQDQGVLNAVSER